MKGGKMSKKVENKEELPDKYLFIKLLSEFPDMRCLMRNEILEAIQKEDWERLQIAEVVVRIFKTSDILEQNKEISLIKSERMPKLKVLEKLIELLEREKQAEKRRIRKKRKLERENQKYRKGGKIMGRKKKELRQKEEKVLLTFLKQTREGKYAKVDETSIPYSRLKEQREEPYDEDEYYYSVR